MNIAFTIPAWLLWVGGITLSLVTIFFAVVGFIFWWNFKDGLY